MYAYLIKILESSRIEWLLAAIKDLSEEIQTKSIFFTDSVLNSNI